MSTKKILIISGCMAVQAKVKGNIKESELYHNVLKEEIFKSHRLIIESTILTYADVKNCSEKVKDYCDSNDIDLILFQIRTMDFFALMNYKKVYKRLDFVENNSAIEQGESKNIIEKYRKIKNQMREKNSWIFRVSKTVKKNILRPPILFLLICLILNKKKALYTYKNLVLEISKYSDQNKIPVLFLGATSRPNSHLEDTLAKHLNDFMLEYVNSINKIYIDIFGKYDSNNNYKFVHTKKSIEKPNLSEIGHLEAARKVKIHIVNTGNLIKSEFPK